MERNPTPAMNLRMIGKIYKHDHGCTVQYIQGGQSRDTHVVISHVLFSFFRSIQGMFHNYFPAFWWLSELSTSAEYPD